jgi:hypothetical protein
MRHKHRDQLIQSFCILVVEPSNRRTIEIEHAEQSFPSNNGTTISEFEATSHAM